MKNETNHQSFILKPSIIHAGGVGVFALHDIAKETYMALFTDKFEEEVRDPLDIPKDLQGYCLNLENGKLLCPKRFNQLDRRNKIKFLWIHKTHNPTL